MCRKVAWIELTVKVTVMEILQRTPHGLNINYNIIQVTNKNA